jgi:hypothetical protein
MEYYTSVSDSFEKKLPCGVVNAANDNNYGAFRIQCACADIQYRSFASNKYVAWLFCNKEAFKILIEIMKESFKREREGKPGIFDWHKFICNVFANNIKLEIVEEILVTFKEEFSDAEQRIAEYMKESRLVDRTYGIGNTCENALDPKLSYEMFERVFPGSNLFPNPEGTWTDPKDGKTYETIKTKRGVEMIKVPYGNPMTMDEALADGVIPDGWRFVTDNEANYARHSVWNPGTLLDRIVPAHSYKSYNTPVDDEIFLFPTYSKMSGISELSGIYMSRWSSPMYVVLDTSNLWELHYDLGEDGIIEESINPLTCKVSLMLCRDIT